MHFKIKYLLLNCKSKNKVKNVKIHIIYKNFKSTKRLFSFFMFSNIYIIVINKNMREFLKLINYFINSSVI